LAGTPQQFTHELSPFELVLVYIDILGFQATLRALFWLITVFFSFFNLIYLFYGKKGK